MFAQHLNDFRAAFECADLGGMETVVDQACLLGGKPWKVGLVDHLAWWVANTKPPATTVLGDRLQTSAQAMSLLCRHGANPNQQMQGLSLLGNAITNNNMPLVRELLAHGASLQEELPWGSTDGTLLMRAVAQNNVVMASFLLDHGVNINQTNPRGETPVAWAVRFNFQEMLLMLHGRGGSVQHRDEMGRNLLSAAVLFHHRDEDAVCRLCRHLVAWGLDPYEVSPQDRNHATAIQLARQWECKRAIGVMEQGVVEYQSLALQQSTPLASSPTPRRTL